MSTLDLALWVAGIIMEAVFVALLLRRRAYRLFPVFCCYVLWTLLSDLGSFAVEHYYPDQYLRVYVLETSIDALLQFCVMVELAWSILRPYWSSLSTGAILIVALSVGLAGLLVWPFATVPGFAGLPDNWQVLMRVQETCSILRVLFFIDLVGCSKVLEVGWRTRELQIAIGLGFYSMVSLVVAILHSYQLESPHYHLLDQIAAFSYFCSLLYWVISFSQKEEPRRRFSPKAHNLLLSVAGRRHPRTPAPKVDSSSKPSGHRAG